MPAASPGSELLVERRPDTPTHKLGEGILKAEPLAGEPALRALQVRLAAFPPVLGRAMLISSPTEAQRCGCKSERRQ